MFSSLMYQSSRLHTVIPNANDTFTLTLNPQEIDLIDSYYNFVPSLFSKISLIYYISHRMCKTLIRDLHKLHNI